MAVEIQAVHKPIQANRLPAKILKVPTVPVRLLLPRANSAIINGTDHRNKKINHGTRNDPPPLAPTILGKRQIFPVPIAAPIVAKISPNLPLNSSEPVSPSDCIRLPPNYAFREVSQEHHVHH